MQIVVSLSVSPRRNMEADDDVDNDYRKYYATWCHACHDTTPSKHTHKMETLLTRTRIRGLHVHVLKGSLHLRPFHRAYFENMTSCGVFYNQADVISEAIKEPCISEKKTWQTKVVWMHWYFSKDVSERSEKENWIHHSFYCTLTAGLIAGNCYLWFQIQ